MHEEAQLREQPAALRCASQRTKYEWHILKCMLVHLSSLPWCATDCVLWAELMHLHFLSPKDVGCRCAPVRDAQLWLLTAHCLQTLNCAKP